MPTGRGGASLPDEYGTCWASLLRTEIPDIAADMPDGAPEAAVTARGVELDEGVGEASRFANSRRLQPASALPAGPQRSRRP